MVNTKTTLSKKVLAIVLAVACMVAFTPAIAFTQSANAASKLKVSPTKATVYVAKTKTIKAKGLSKKHLKKVKWTTSKKSVVSISKTKGSYTKAKGKKAGTAYVTAKYGKYKAKAKIVVKKVSLKSVSVTGTAKIGNVLTATTNPTNATGVTYQWYRVATSGAAATGQATAIANATGKTYTVKPADAGFTIIVKAKAGSKTVTSSETDIIAPLDFTSVTITGMSEKSDTTLKTADTPVVGDTLTATTDAKAIASNATFQWYRGTAAIVGATSQTYKVVDNDLGSTLEVKVTYKHNVKAGTVTTKTDTTKAVKTSLSSAAITLSPTTTPTVGTTLSFTAKLGTTTLTSGTDYTTAWYKDSYDAAKPTVNRLGTTATYAVTKDEIGHKIIVVITAGSTSNYVGTAKVETAAVTQSLQKAVLTLDGDATGVDISDTKKQAAGVGSTLEAAVTDNSGNVVESKNLTYQWTRGGNVISGATGSTYTLTKDDITAVDSGVQYKVTCTGTGSYTGSVTKVALLGDITTATNFKGYTVQKNGKAISANTAVQPGDELSIVMNPSAAKEALYYVWTINGNTYTGSSLKITDAMVSGITTGAAVTVVAKYVGDKNDNWGVTGLYTSATTQDSTTEATTETNGTSYYAKNGTTQTITAVKAMTSLTFKYDNNKYGNEKATGYKAYTTPEVFGYAHAAVSPATTGTYQWYRDAADGTGTTIASATNADYQIEAADMGHKLICVFTGDAGAYDGSTIQTETPAVAASSRTIKSFMVVNNSAPAVKVTKLENGVTYKVVAVDSNDTVIIDGVTVTVNTAKKIVSGDIDSTYNAATGDGQVVVTVTPDGANYTGSALTYTFDTTL